METEKKQQKVFKEFLVCLKNHSEKYQGHYFEKWYNDHLSKQVEIKILKKLRWFHVNSEMFQMNFTVLTYIKAKYRVKLSNKDS